MAKAPPAAQIGAAAARPGGRGLQQRLPRAPRAGNFDEGARQVRRLLDRDRQEMDYDELEKSFAPSPAAAEGGAAPAPPSPSGFGFVSGVEPASPAEAAAQAALPTPGSSSSAADKTRLSPFGPSGGGAAPFVPAPGRVPGFASPNKPFAEPAGLSPTMRPDAIVEEPWWKRITLAQVVIAATFTASIGLMIATFFVVVKMGAVHFNE